MHLGTALLPLLSLVLWFQSAYGWNKWNYTVQWSTVQTQVSSLQQQWRLIWSPIAEDGVTPTYVGDDFPPRPRRGHSFHVIKTDVNSDYKGAVYLVLFGGRDNNQKAEHIPKTYDVITVNGTIEFDTYDEKPVSPCNDPENKFWTKEEQEGCSPFNQTSRIDVGLIYNDVWAYKLCNSSGSDNADRGFDTECKSTGWELWHAGALQGGCTIQLGIEVCTVPSERYNHASVMHDDGTLYVYGGFSQRCADYCDDIWFFDIYYKSWRQVYAEGALTKFYNDTFDDATVLNDPKLVPIDANTTSAFAGPGKRWRHSMEIGTAYYNETLERWLQPSAIYGGHRLWHGYSPENSQDNNWDVYETRPIGGYLDDLWIYTKYLDTTTVAGSAFKTNDGKWEKKEPKEQCFDSPGISWDSRNDISCTTIKPVGRASHGSAFDSPRNRVWIFGGYTTYYPYLRTDGQGSGPGVTSVGSGGFIPYPGYDYFRNDLWYYDLKESLWIEVTPEEGYPVPDPRQDPVFLLVGDLIFMHGGFSDNYIYDDTWYFNITSLRWLQKKEFVRPVYAEDCTDDFEYIAEHNDSCVKLSWPKHLDRSELTPFEVLPYKNQSFYWPDGDYPYYGIFDLGLSETDPVLTRLNATPVEGTPLFPYAATGPMQYARPFIHNFDANTSATLYERCTSVVGEPTRGRLVDGLNGRSNGSVFIPQPRRQRPGWDGCRDRYDGRTDLPQGLQYVMPLPRYNHRAIFHNDTSEIIMYGGMAYLEPQAKSLSNTWESTTLADMWYFNLHHCVNNCSSHGSCSFGFCKCNVGYYGNDCSNTSCPGTFCYYDEYTNEQNCTHACQAGYTHTDADTYVQDIYKIPCTEENWGESNGICDGHGSVQCAPPFLGDDCGTKDCKSNCSFNGWCSIEYPVSRCLCIPGYFGEICEHKVCLNNCSYPNGVCNTTSGSCNCNMMYSPYNNTREYKPWGGEDCSYIMAYAGAPLGAAAAVRWWVCLFVLVLALHLALLSGSNIFSEDDAVVGKVGDSNGVLGANGDHFVLNSDVAY